MEIARDNQRLIPLMHPAHQEIDGRSHAQADKAEQAGGLQRNPNRD
jgi:hypothetical protein